MAEDQRNEGYDRSENGYQGYNDDSYNDDYQNDDHGRSGKYRDEIYSNRVPAGKRTYFFDV